MLKRRNAKQGLKKIEIIKNTHTNAWPCVFDSEILCDCVCV